MLKYFKSKEFFVTLGVIVGGFLALYLLTFFVFLPWYTNHGEEVKVPKITEMVLEKAAEKLDEEGLEYHVVDSLYRVDLPPLTIISQDPVAGSMVKPGRTIYVTVNKVLAPMVKFPDITGVSQYQAKLRLEGAGLTLGKMTYVPHEFSNLVLRATHDGKDMKEGTELRKGSKIDLVIGEGKGNQRIAVPDLTGETFESAMAIIHRLGLNIGSINFDPGSPRPQGTVVQQHPTYAEGDSVRVGAEFDLWVAGQQPSEQIESGGGDTITGGK
jgi:beta-lactam-binding protein with PASTA domain